MISHYKAKYLEIKNSLLSASKSKSFKYAVPFFLLVIGGSFGLKEWSQLRYTFKKVKGVTDEEARSLGLNRHRKVTLEDAYEEIKDIDTDNWENVRVPRPWEPTNNQQKK